MRYTEEGRGVGVCILICHPRASPLELGSGFRMLVVMLFLYGGLLFLSFVYRIYHGVELNKHSCMQRRFLYCL